MLKPALMYKKKIEDGFASYFYSDDMMYFTGGVTNHLVCIQDENKGDLYQYAVIGEDNKLIGYIYYKVDLYSSRVTDVGAFSFVRGNPLMGRELYDLLEELVNKFHTITFLAISGNHAIKGYDKFLEMHSDIGKKHTLTDSFKDKYGNYHDTYIYEFINNKIK